MQEPQCESLSPRILGSGTSPSIDSNMEEINNMFRFNSVLVVVFVASSAFSLAQAAAAATPSDSSAATAQALLEAFTTSLAAGNTTSSENLVAQNLDKLRSALSSLNISLPSGSTVNSSALASLANIIQTFLNTASASNTSLPLVKAASGLADSLLSGSTSISSFQSQLADLKARYQAALKYLQTDDAVRIGGYLLTLDSLGLQAISAYPIAEATLFVAELSLCSAIASLAGGILYTVSTALGLAGSIISLQLTLQSAYPNGQPPGPGPHYGSQDGLTQSYDMINALTYNADTVTRDLLPLVLGGGMTSPLALATDILSSSSSSLNRLANFAAPQSVLNRLSLLQMQIQSGPFAQAISATTAGSGKVLGSVAAAAANLAGANGLGRRSMQNN